MKKIMCVWLLLPVLLCSCGRAAAVEYDIADDAGNTGSEVREADTGSANPDTTDETAAGAESADETGTAPICVYICGAVEHPDVYILPAGSRVYEAIAAAGGMTDEAEARALNLAELLSDGQQITVLSREEAEQGMQVGPQSFSGGPAADAKVNINTATKEQLMTLPGIGEVKAEAILTYRADNGGFPSVEAIREISGIGEKSYEKLKDLITV